MAPRSTSSPKQVGGQHYKQTSASCPHCGGEIQHWDLYAQSPGLIYSATKHISRHRVKNGKEDLLKAITEIQKIIAQEYPEQQLDFDFGGAPDTKLWAVDGVKQTIAQMLGVIDAAQYPANELCGCGRTYRVCQSDFATMRPGEVWVPCDPIQEPLQGAGDKVPEATPAQQTPNASCVAPDSGAAAPTQPQYPAPWPYAPDKPEDIMLADARKRAEAYAQQHDNADVPEGWVLEPTHSGRWHYRKIDGQWGPVSHSTRESALYSLNLEIRHGSAECTQIKPKEQHHVSRTLHCK